MLRLLIWFGQFLFAGSAIYTSLISLFGLRRFRVNRGSGGESNGAVRVVVPAHDEGAVIAGIAEDLANQTYQDDLLRVCVVADRCTDSTTEIAGRFVEVAVRSEGGGAKGAAIAWYLEREPLDEGEALIVLDADNRVESGYVSLVAAALNDGADVLQSYLDVANPDGSPLATANALTYWASNPMVQLSRSNIGWSADLGGTGMAFTKAALDSVGGFSDDLTDDLALNLRLNLAGYRTKWLGDARVFDEKPTGAAATVTQRSRWVRGRRDAQRRYGFELIRRGVTEREPALLDLAFRLYNPGRSFIALVVASLALIAAKYPVLGLWPWLFHASVAAVAVLLPVVFLIKERVPARYIIRYPYVTFLALLWFPIRVGSRLLRGWKRTQHKKPEQNNSEM